MDGNDEPKSEGSDDVSPSDRQEESKPEIDDSKDTPPVNPVPGEPTVNHEEGSEEGEEEDEGDKPISFTQAAIWGKMDFKYPRTAREVRIYVHSAGGDTVMERAYLKERSYPTLRRYCRERGCDFHVIDLHTCDADEHHNDHVTLDICLKEIETCVEKSIGPHFLTFLSQKYGKPTLPRRIDYDVMKRYLKQPGPSEEEKQLLSSWYVSDDNSFPLAYILSPVETVISHYENGTDTEALKQWLEAKSRTVGILQQVAGKEETSFNMSVAEEELKRYLSASTAPEDTRGRGWFRREVTDLMESTADDAAGSYIDLSEGQVDEDAQKRLAELRETTMSTMFPDEFIKSFELGWDALFEEEDKMKYLETVRESFEETVTCQINEAMDHLRQSESDTWSFEIIRHIKQARRHVDTFIGRNSFIDKIEDTLKEQEIRIPMIVYGEAGCGKTALISKLAAVIPEWYWLSNPAVILRTHEIRHMCSTRELLSSLCAHIHRVNDETTLVDDIPRDYEKLQEYFIELIAGQQEKKNTICVLLDVFDMLPTKECADITKWLPKTLPRKVLFIATVTNVGKLWKSIKKHCPDSLLPISDLDAEDMTDIVKNLLKSSGRALQAGQWEILEYFCPSYPSPFHMHLGASTAISWAASDNKKKCGLPEDIQRILTLTFERLEAKHGADYVSVVFGFLCASHAGLSLSELEGLAAEHPKIPALHKAKPFPGIRTLPLLYLIRDSGFYITEKNVYGSVLYGWGTKLVADVAEKRYLTEDVRMDFHTKLLDYFVPSETVSDEANATSTTTSPYATVSSDSKHMCYDSRALTETFHQLIMSKQLPERMDSVHLNVDYIHAKLDVTSVEQILSDLSLIEEQGMSNADLRSIQTCLENNKAVLVEDSTLLPLCLLQKLTKSPDDMSGQMETFLNQAKSPGFNCLLSSLVRVPLDKDYAKLGTFSGPTKQIQSIDINKDGSKCLAVSQDNFLRVWDTDDVDEIDEIELAEYEPYLSCDFLPLARFCHDDEWVVLGSTTILNFIDIEEEELVRRIEMSEDAQLDVAFIHDANQIFVVGGSEILVWNIESGEKEGSLDISNPIEIEDETLAGRVEDYIGIHSNDVIFHRAGGTVVKVFHHNTDRKTDSYALYGKTEALERVVRFALTSSGLLICYHFVPPTPTAENAAPSLEGTIDIVDTETVAKVHSFKEQDGGLFITLERVFPLGENQFGVVCHPAGCTQVRVYDITSKTAKDAFYIQGDFINHLASSGDGDAVLVTRNNPNEMELIDFNKALELKQQETYSGDKDPEGAEILYELPNTRRYVLFMTSDQALAVWDLAHRICVRILEIAFPGTYAAATSSTMVVGIDPDSIKLMALDMRDGHIAESIENVAYKIHDSHLRVDVAADGTVVLVGPKANTLSGVDIAEGTITWSCEVDDCECIGGVIVSDNGRIAICEVPDAADTASSDSSPPPTESRLIAFELKGAKRLSDLKLETTKPLSTRLVVARSAFLTPDGAHYVTSAFTKDGTVYAVFDTADGSVRCIPKLDDAHGISLGYSASLQSCVIGYTDGKLRLWRLSDFDMEVIDTGKLQPITRMFSSQDGVYAACFFKEKMCSLYLYNLRTKTKHGVYVSNENIISCFFTSQSEFLLVSREKSRGLVQLCIHTAFKENNQVDADVNTSPKDSENRKNSLAANDINTRPSSGRKSARTKRRRSIASRRGSQLSTVVDEPDKSAGRRYVEDTYLENMMKQKDVFGEPAEFECFD